MAFHHPNELLEESDTEMSCSYSPKTGTQAAIILNEKFLAVHKIKRIFKIAGSVLQHFIAACCVVTQSAACTDTGAECLPAFHDISVAKNN